MGLDKERIMLLLQKRYNALREVGRITGELADCVSRGDQVSVSLLIQMRQDELVQVDVCQNEIGLMAEKKPEYAPAIRELITSDPFAVRPPGTFEEQKIFEIRQKTSGLIKEIQEKDRYLNLRVGGNRSYYAKTNK